MAELQGHSQNVPQCNRAIRFLGRQTNAEALGIYDLTRLLCYAFGEQIFFVQWAVGTFEESKHFMNGNSKNVRRVSKWSKLTLGIEILAPPSLAPPFSLAISASSLVNDF
jgi:hypothetical protein